MESYNQQLISIDLANQKYVEDLSITSKEHVDDAMQKFNEWFYKDETLWCKRLMLKLEKSAEQQNYIKEQFKNSQELQMLKTDLQVLEKSIKFVQMVRSGKYGKEWFKYIDNDEQKILYRREGTSDLYTFYLEKVVNAPMFDLLSVIAEVQTYKDWVPLMYKSEFFNEVSQFRKMVETQVTVPWPWDNRSVYAGVGALPIENESALCVTIKTTNQWLKGMPIKKDGKCTECYINFMTVYIKSISEKKQRCSFIMNIDPQISSLPDWLINQFMKIMTTVFLKQIAKKAENLSEQYHKLIKEKHVFYKQMKDLLIRLDALREREKQQAEGPTESTVEESKVNNE